MLFKWEIENHDEAPLNVNIKSSNLTRTFVALNDLFMVAKKQNIESFLVHLVATTYFEFRPVKKRKKNLLP